MTSAPNDPEVDYSRPDIQMIATLFGMTIEHFIEYGLPPADYLWLGVEYWRKETFLAWQTKFHAAWVKAEMADDPDHARKFFELVDLVQSQRDKGED